MALQITSNVTQLLPDIFSGSSHEHHLQKRQAGGAAVATGVLALATIAMITEFIVYSGFTPKVRSNSSWFAFKLIVTLYNIYLGLNTKFDSLSFFISTPNAEYFFSYFKYGYCTSLCNCIHSEKSTTNVI